MRNVTAKLITNNFILYFTNFLALVVLLVYTNLFQLGRYQIAVSFSEFSLSRSNLKILGHVFFILYLKLWFQLVYLLHYII